MRKLSTLFLFVMAVAFANAQTPNPYCDGQRYLTDVFTAVDVTSAVQYGANTTVGGAQQNLLMDIYTPQGDVATQRPVVFVGFGGSFVTGARGDVAPVCEKFARMGYVAVGFDYRLFDVLAIPDSATMLDVVCKAVGDLRAAIRYMRENATTYAVDTNYVFAGGISAGAILALHATYITDIAELPGYVASAVNANGGLPGNSSSNFSYSHSIQGAFSMSGALHKMEWIVPGDTPISMVHETDDTVVPYNWDFARAFGIPVITVHGGGDLHPYCDANGIRNEFISVNAAAHVGYINNATVMDQFYANTGTIFTEVMCGATGVHELANTLAVSAYPVPSNGQITINTEITATDYTLTITDVLGHQVMSRNHINGTQVSIDNLAAGIYFANVHSAEGTGSVRFVVE